MAKARALDRRRKSIRGIRKITRTMELISTAQFKRAMDRATAANQYSRRLSDLVGHLLHGGTELRHPLLQPRPQAQRATLLVLSANRGLCGGYNAAVMRLASARLNELRREHAEVRLEVSGKRGISAFRFRKIGVDEAFTHLAEKPNPAEVDVLAERYLTDFLGGRLDRLDVVYTRFESASRQQAVAETLLPLGQLEAGESADQSPHKAAHPQYEFLPSAAEVLDEIVPMSFRVRLLRCLLDAAASEQIARMVAMKAATENADGMISRLSMAYNRARQGQITGELLEIIGGAEALNG
jgi:F-type H+-transporting ATPase subunit gamma